MKVAVIGGGPAGMMAAYTAAQAGARVTLYEQNEKLGKKLFLTGKGRCNFTNARPIAEFFEQIPQNPKFLYSALYRFDNERLMALLSRHGLRIKTERGGRVFPSSDKSSDVINTLQHMLKSAGVTIVFHTSVEDICVKNGQVHGVRVKGQSIEFDCVILATGGLSYPSTGSTGDGHKFSRQAGHTITAMKPALIPLTCKGPSAAMCKALTGLSLKNVELTLWEQGVPVFTERGEMLFTHFGISGPLVLSASAHIKDYNFVSTQVHIDLKPALSVEVLDARLLKEFDVAKNKQLKTLLYALLPKALSEPVLAQAGIPKEVYVHSVTKQQRQVLLRTLKSFVIEIAGTRPIKEAIITSGGVSVAQLNPSTMESKLISGLYMCGELLDVHGYTGGYNLQIAFSTGSVAGHFAGTTD